MKSSLSEQIDIEIFQLGTKNKFFEKKKSQMQILSQKVIKILLVGNIMQ